MFKCPEKKEIASIAPSSNQWLTSKDKNHTASQIICMENKGVKNRNWTRVGKSLFPHYFLISLCALGEKLVNSLQSWNIWHFFRMECLSSMNKVLGRMTTMKILQRYLWLFLLLQIIYSNYNNWRVKNTLAVKTTWKN